MKYKQCVVYVYDDCHKADGADCNFNTCKIRLTKEKEIINNTIKRRTEFKNLSKKEQDKWCSKCGCEGGCDLCKNIND
jgi:hypothetical protein